MRSGCTRSTETPRRSRASSSARARTRKGAGPRSVTSRRATPQSHWDVGDQPPEFWNQFKTEFAPGTHLRIHPLLDWTELNIWEYIKRENIPMVSLTTTRATGKRYRSLGVLAAHPGRRIGRAATWTTSSSSSQSGEVREHRRAVGRGAGQGRRAAVGWKSSDATDTCNRMLTKGPNTPSRPSSPSPSARVRSRCGSPTWREKQQILAEVPRAHPARCSSIMGLPEPEREGRAEIPLARIPGLCTWGQIVRTLPRPSVPGRPEPADVPRRRLPKTRRCAASTSP